MSGEPEHGFPAFRAAAADLRERGYDIVSPAEIDEEEGFDPKGKDVEPGSKEWADFLARDILIVASPDTEGVIVLPNWAASRGAALEVHVAKELGKPVLAYPDLEPVRTPPVYKRPSEETVLEEAQRLVGGDRGDDYGHPADDFGRTADLWRSLWGWNVTPERVALAMICVKLSRLAETPSKRDSVTDIAGYARTYEMVRERQGEPLK